MLRLTLLLLLLFHPFGATSILAQDHPTQASPFDAMRWLEQQPQVQIGGKWYIPIAIDGVEVEKILEKCRQQWPGQLQKRFSEDLMEAMALMGHEPAKTVTLRLKASPAAKEVVLEGISNTLGKRQQLLRDNATRNSTPLRLPPSWLSKKQVEEEIAAFAAALRDQFAYLHLKGIDLDEAIEKEVRNYYSKGLPDRMPPVDLVMILQRVLMQFGDGHADIRSSNFRLGEGEPFNPFLLDDIDGKVVAYQQKRNDLLDPKYPYVVSLDGRPIEDCIDDMTPFIPSGSPQLVRHRAIRLLRAISWWRRVEDGGFHDHERVMYRPFDLELSSRDGKKTRTVKVQPSDHKPPYRQWPHSESRLLEENIGYLRLVRMDHRAVEDVYRWMPRFRDTDGLIVDVRGNGGGTREALLALAGFLLGDQQSPWVGNFAVYRKSSNFDADHLANRFMRRIDSDEWTPEQRLTIDLAFATFKPEWQVPDGFSQWHALLLDGTGHPQEFPYTQEVVILSDAGCFSATDIFLGALEIHPRVTLMGTASSGGSARSQQFSLPHSGIEVKCASMASFRPNGKLYDGHGVEVDIEVHPDPSFFIKGGQDRVLKAAITHLRSR